MAFDPGTHDVLMFGGFGVGQNNPLNDSWLWNGSDWLQQTPGASPSKRGQVGMGTDTTSGGVILFGGNIFGGRGTFGPPTNNCFAGPPPPECALADTWLWKGSTWQQLNIPGPSPRAQASIASTPLKGLPVLFGGQERGGVYEGLAGDTWIESGGAWSQQNTPVHPSPRSAIGFAGTFFPQPGYILVGGRRHDFNPAGFTWFLAATGPGPSPTGAWTRLTPVTTPPPAYASAMATDPTTNTPLLWSGRLNPGGDTAQTWRFGQ